MVLWIRQLFGELRIVGKDQQSAGVQIQPSDRRNELIDAPDQVVNRQPPLGIFVRGDVALGLVEKNVKALRGFERLSVEGHAIAPKLNPVVGILDHLSVHRDAARMDPAPRIRAGA